MERKISSKPVDVSRLSPMMRQYWKVKEQYLEQLLFFRLGDFYELFFAGLEQKENKNLSE